ncbi:MAG: glycosyltransferase family 2 protein [Firmicutes bacterium]|nr:glycosyltransferase family 2 protein [Bacillota bacterium]
MTSRAQAVKLTETGPVSVVIAARNEASSIAATVGAVSGLPHVSEVIVVDDWSSDDTAVRAREAGAAVLRPPVHTGKGGALKHGVKAATGRVILFLDGDLGDSAREAARLLDPVLEGRADMCLGKLVKADPQPQPGDRRGGFGLVKGLARWGTSKLGGLALEEPLSGQRALLREVLERIPAMESGFGVETALNIDVGRLGLKVVEVPVRIRHRVTGRDLSGFLHRGRQFAAVAGVLLKRAVRR